MQGAASVLARGWWRGMRRWWVGTGLVLSLVLTVVLSVGAVFAGLQEETEVRVAAFFTDDLRVTRGSGGAAPEAVWAGTEVAEAEQRLRAAGAGEVLPRLESQYVLSRRSLVQAYLQEQEQFELRTPGGELAGTDFYGLGVLVGLDMEDSRAGDRVRPYLLAGRLPHHDPEVVELLMSAPAFAEYLSPEERASLRSWPPPEAESRRFRFEITAARVDPDGAVKDIIRRPAEVVGLYASRVDVVDSFVLVADAPDVRMLLGHPANGTAVNAFTIHGGDVGGVAAAARSEGWQAQSAQSFAERYVGQLMRVVRSLSVGLSGMFIVLPLFLAWHGVSQMLQSHQREYAVCRAIGVPAPLIARAIGAVVVAVVGASVLLGVALVALADVALDPVLGSWRALPIPVRYSLDVPFTVGILAGVVLSMVVAVLAALRRHLRADLPSALRAS